MIEANELEYEEEYKPSEIMQQWTELIIQLMSAWKYTEEQKDQTLQLFADYLEVVFDEGHTIGYEDGVNTAWDTLKDLHQKGIQIDWDNKRGGKYNA